MNKTFTLFIFVLFSGGLFNNPHACAQAPEKMSYQAVVRNGSGQLQTNASIGMQISILQGGAEGQAVYVERHFPVTTENGLVTVEIGSGTGIAGSFAEIDWSDGIYFIKTETDLNGGANFTITGTSQLLSVPYALHSGSAAILTGEVTQSQISDLPEYLTQEEDPVFSAWDKDYADLTNRPDMSVYATKNMNNARITNLADPQNNQDAVTRAYVDALVYQVMNSFAKSNEEFTSPTTGTVTDVDGNHYKIVKVGGQWWMAENLRVFRYRNGDAIPTGYTDIDWGGLATGAYAIYPHTGLTGLNSDAEVLDAYGALYNWYTVNDQRGICPAGWHVPLEADFLMLAGYLGGTDSPNGNKIKSCRQVGSPEGKDCNTTEHPRWDSNASHWGTDDYGLAALPGGQRYSDGLYYNAGKSSFWWAVQWETSVTASRTMTVAANQGKIYWSVYTKNNGMAVRCLKD
jgi:uncharacterized protein (TIGR02145 family)